ncbi:N-6 DNA methylase [Streptomyces sp. NPDC006645]|uniref:N-6 DNA methylase n=1 Tax=unclassified Streptomyces TaxID=2593676 RepID=UPI0033BCFBE3
MPKSTGTSPVAVSLAEIARLAGVGRAAVSNWRRRYETFPAPIGGTDTSPLFSLPDVETWLHAENKIKNAVGSLERLGPELESLGERDATGRLIAAVGIQLSGAEESDSDQKSLGAREARFLARVTEVASVEGASRTFGFLVDRWLRTHVRQITTTPEPLAQLMTAIASTVRAGEVRTLLDPACGTGALLLSGAVLRKNRPGTGIFGQDNDPVLAALTSARLAMAGFTASVTSSDTLLADAHSDVRADVVLCNPPSNERDWGHAELATDGRWAFGHPPRTESELAWVQHAVASLAPDGVAVLLLPPAVAARRAGRRIRAGLLRSGALQAVIALPPGAAPPHGVGLHLWVLRSAESTATSRADLLLVDTAHGLDAASLGKTGINWPRLLEGVPAALRGEHTYESMSIPVIDLLDEQVDLTPARHIPFAGGVDGMELRRSWTQFDTHLRELRDTAGVLSALSSKDTDNADPQVSLTTVAELERAGALTVLAGQALPEDLLQRGAPPKGAVPVLTVPGLLSAGSAGYWLAGSEVARGEVGGTLTVTAGEDVILVGVTRAFNVMVDSGAPSVLGSNLYALRTDPTVLDPWFLAGCLRAPGNARQAGTHATTSSRVDVRRLHVPRMPLKDQQAYGEIYRKVASFEREMRGLGSTGAELARSLGDLMSTGRLNWK